jgi:four helix bundle protein
MSGFRELKVWQRSKDLAVKVYKITQQGQFKCDYGLTDQMRRAAVSIPSNIAEGDERGTTKDAVRFFHIAKGSLAELQTQLEIAYEIQYINIETKNKIIEECENIGEMLGSLIKSRL